MTDIYTPAIMTLLEQLAGDKSIPPQYRNPLVSDGRRWMLQILGARTIVDPKKVAGGEEMATSAPGFVKPNGNPCTCPEGGRRADCPWHGGSK